MSFIEIIKEKAKSNIKTIVLPEANDIRTLEAAEIVLDEGFAKVILIRKQGRDFQTCRSKKFKIIKCHNYRTKNFFRL